MAGSASQFSPSYPRQLDGGYPRQLDGGQRRTLGPEFACVAERLSSSCFSRQPSGGNDYRDFRHTQISHLVSPVITTRRTLSHGIGPGASPGDVGRALARSIASRVAEASPPPQARFSSRCHNSIASTAGASPSGEHTPRREHPQASSAFGQASGPSSPARGYPPWRWQSPAPQLQWSSQVTEALVSPPMAYRGVNNSFQDWYPRADPASSSSIPAKARSSQEGSGHRFQFPMVARPMEASRSLHSQTLQPNQLQAEMTGWSSLNGRNGSSRSVRNPQWSSLPQQPLPTKSMGARGDNALQSGDLSAWRNAPVTVLLPGQPVNPSWDGKTASSSSVVRLPFTKDLSQGCANGAGSQRTASPRTSLNPFAMRGTGLSRRTHTQSGELVPEGQLERQRPRDAWNVEQTIRLGSTLDEVKALNTGARLLDSFGVVSVGQAVEKLNEGQFCADEDFCIAWSASNRAYFLLFRSGMEEAAVKLVGGPAALESKEPRTTLAAGAVLRIGGRPLEVVGPLGMGSFGMVWSATLQDKEGEELAVKEMICKSEAELRAATYEGDLLLQLKKVLPAGEKESSRVPSFVASETKVSGIDQWTVRLAMTRIPGVPLDHFLEGLRRADNGSIRGPARQQERFTQACNFAYAMISQLTPTFEKFSSLAYHRDVNSHNILVEGSAGHPRFGLVDFGLAADRSCWDGVVGSLSWHLMDIGGDCRYWPMSAWLQFEYGWQALVKYPQLAVEYQWQLDLHALGITALQVLATMSFPDEGEYDETLPEEIQALRLAWEQYWKDATHFWTRLLHVFRTSGDQNAVKVLCIEEDVHNTIGANLTALRGALREALAAGSILAGQAVPLFSALLELVSAGGVTGLDEELKYTTWGSVSEVLHGNS